RRPGARRAGPGLSRAALSLHHAGAPYPFYSVTIIDFRKLQRCRRSSLGSEPGPAPASSAPTALSPRQPRVCSSCPQPCHFEHVTKVVCECGYTRQQHLEEATRPHAWQGKDWDPKKHVQEMPTDAFGDIVFTGLGQKVGKYVRLSQDTPPSVIYHLMTQYWGLDVPNLLISVTGGAKDFNMKPRLKSVFRRGLVKVAQTTGSPRGLEPRAG
uniref:transient receptor potential cation channel subfamily M member 2-like n=1 Tax=Panthera onca TaxID=9690 RepID=UPI0029536817